MKHLDAVKHQLKISVRIAEGIFAGQVAEKLAGCKLIRQTTGGLEKSHESLVVSQEFG